jgi:diguanylate cyclase (GGDEF)-like protein
MKRGFALPSIGRRLVVVSLATSGTALALGLAGLVATGLLAPGWAGIFLALAICLAAALAALLLTSRLHAAVARPLGDLVETARRVSRERDFSVRAVKHGDDELDVLVDGFNDMLAHIGEGETRLKEAHLELEKRVEERTRELQQEIAARQRVEQTIRQLAYFDALTGLPNRVLFNDRLSQALTYAERNKEMVAVMLLDLDRFKTINDTLGHAMGDRVLKAVAQRLRGCLRAEDTVARIGGDEFPVLLPGVRVIEDAVKVAEKIVETLRPPFELEGHRLYATASVGLALFPVHGQDGATLVKNADTALYRAKDHGRDNCQLYTTGTGDRAFERLVLENSLRRALEQNEFTLHYQPVIEPASGVIVTVEALLRWMHPELGLLLPSAFMGLAEETGLILPLGEWVLKTACDQVRAWQQAGLAARLSVNLSARHFRQRDLVERIQHLLAAAGLAATDLTIEVKESVILDNAEGTLALLHALRALGINLAVDDFGTGYSSLAHLRRLPANTLKIDQAFIQDIPSDPGSVAIAHLIITMAHSLGLQVVAEGVETEAQFDFLVPAGCDFLQGNLFCRAVAPQEMTLLLRQGRLSRADHAPA